MQVLLVAPAMTGVPALTRAPRVGDRVRIRPSFPCHTRRGEAVWREHPATQELVPCEGHDPYEARLTGTVIRRCHGGGHCGAVEDHPYLVSYKERLSVAGGYRVNGHYAPNELILVEDG